jgi:Transposase DDE domain
MRGISRPSTARCTLPIYVNFLLSEPKSATCRQLGNIMNISHDSVNRFLNRESYSPLDLFNEIKGELTLKGGTLSVDDSVLDKPYSHYIAYVGYFWSGKHHRAVKGINLITLYYTDPQGRHQPVNFRVYDKAEGKTKNDYFLEMLKEVLAWGLEPACVTGDSWFSCTKNLKAVKNHGLGFVFGLESNRLVSLRRGESSQVQAVNVPENGLVVWLPQFGYVKVFRTRLKDQVRHYIYYVPEKEVASNEDEEKARFESFKKTDFKHIHDQHWQIEQYHRTIKQVCNIERFQVRSKTAVKNHLFSAIFGYVELQRMRAINAIKNCYSLRHDLFKNAIASFIKTASERLQHLNPVFYSVVNA